MSNLLTTLYKMQEVLSSLSNALDKEQHQLAAGEINSNLLQRITENKGALLATLNYHLDEMRRSTEQQLGTWAPYASHSDMTRRWQNIGQMTSCLNDANIHNGLLLNQQICFTEEALTLLKPHQTKRFTARAG